MVSTWIYNLLLTNHGILAPEDLAIHEERWTPANPHAMSVRRECQSSPPKISDMTWHDMTQEMRILCTSMPPWRLKIEVIQLDLQQVEISFSDPYSFSHVLSSRQSRRAGILPWCRCFQTDVKKPSFYFFAFPCFDESPQVENEQMNFNH